MPHETFMGPDVSSVLAEAQRTLGAEAVVISMRRLGPRAPFELVATDATGREASRRVAAALPEADRSSMAPPIELHRARRQGAPAVIALVGPTGAGKTTTLAKLANHPRVLGGRAVGLLCLDTYRIGATEQLRIYAELSRLPLELVYEPRDLAPAVRRLSDREVILVDTPGRGPHARADLSATHELLMELNPAEIHLALPAGLQLPLARRIVANHRSRGVTHLIATKLDEAPDDPTVFDLAAEFRLPMRWLTDGQEVPGDLQTASPAALASALRRAAAFEAAVIR